MKLSAQQLQQFNEQSYLFFPEKFTTAEAELMREAAKTVYAMSREDVWRESSGVARTAFAAHRDFTPIEPLADDCLSALTNSAAAA